ncbi:MAG: UbiA family prenyltransferase [Saprospiraceae bacterium]
MLAKLIFWLKVSRPGLWFATIWLYILPTSQMDIWASPHFWLGFFYCCFPLNFLVYGWNDMVDHETDRLNPRKDSFLFGAQGSPEQLRNLWKPILLVQSIFFALFVYLESWPMLLLLTSLVAINALYNLPKHGLRSRPPLELLCQIGYLLVAPFSILLNDTAALPWQTYLYLFLFALQSHLMGEVMDIEPDRKAKRKTTATVIGRTNTKWLIIFLVSAEVYLLFFLFQEIIFGTMLVLALLWLLLDLFLIYKNKNYTLQQMQLFGVSSNIIAIASMSYVWYSACLLSVA